MPIREQNLERQLYQQRSVWSATAAVTNGANQQSGGFICLAANEILEWDGLFVGAFGANVVLGGAITVILEGAGSTTLLTMVIPDQTINNGAAILIKPTTPLRYVAPSTGLSARILKVTAHTSGNMLLQPILTILNQQTKI